MTAAIQERAAGADDERWAAEQAVRMHREPPSTERSTGRCAQCHPGGGCPMLAWALAYLKHLDAIHTGNAEAVRDAGP